MAINDANSQILQVMHLVEKERSPKSESETGSLSEVRNQFFFFFIWVLENFFLV